MRRSQRLISVVAFVAAMPVLAGCYYNDVSNNDANDDTTSAAGNPNGSSGSHASGSTTGSKMTTSGNGGAGGGNGGASPTSADSSGSGAGSTGSGSPSTGSSSASTGSGSASTGSGSSSTGSGMPPPQGQHYLTYKYDLPANAAVPNVLSIYDEAKDANGVHYLRPNPWDATEYGSAYYWGMAVDSHYDTDCVSYNSLTVECTVMRPAHAHIEVNVHDQYSGTNPATRWSCEDPLYGNFTLWIDGVQTGYSYIDWFDAEDGPACRYYFILP